MELCGVITMIGLKKGRKFSGVNKLTSHNAELHITFSFAIENRLGAGGLLNEQASYRICAMV
jgi:hypothetical protein